MDHPARLFVILESIAAITFTLAGYWAGILLEVKDKTKKKEEEFRVSFNVNDGTLELDLELPTLCSACHGR